VNNPVGISLTVASSFARRAEMFEAMLKSPEGGLRRSQLEEFVRSSRDASEQLVANLQRAGELIQSFKQVAVDRSHAERRTFMLGEATDQIITSLKPVLKRAAITLAVDVPEGLPIDGYPGSYGQILTNLFLNAVNHAFADGRAGTISITAPPAGVMAVGGYRFLAQDLHEWSRRLGQGALLTALPDRLSGHRLAGRAMDNARARDALAELGLNPLMVEAFRDRANQSG
ncbi:MAG: hypothetical protein E6833_04675, partial [Bradyrhizobium sp.]|nr:hypothetical protein [Bradyrhizobium sp.]